MLLNRPLTETNNASAIAQSFGRNTMKTLLSLMISGSLAVAAEPLTMKLDYKEGKEDDYAAQIQSAFTKLLTSDSALSKEFAKFEALTCPQILEH